MIGTHDLTMLPEPERLRRLMQSLAVLDAILSADWELRYYSFNSAWSEGEMMGSMRNGQGDEVFVLFSAAGCFLKGFDHERALEGVPAEAFYGQLPEPFRGQAREPAFSPDDVTFCCWRAHSDTAWSRALVPSYAGRDGSEDLLRLLAADPGDYADFASSYHELEIPPASILAVYEHRPLTRELVSSLNPARSWSALAEDLAEIGYPAGEP